MSPKSTPFFKVSTFLGFVVCGWYRGTQLDKAFITLKLFPPRFYDFRFFWGSKIASQIHHVKVMCVVGIEALE